MVVRFLIVFWFLRPDPLFVEADEIDSISCYGYDDGFAMLYGEVRVLILFIGIV